MGNYSKKGGRPLKGLGQKKTYRINIKLITEEYYSLVAKVKNAKVTISDFVRDCLQKGYVKERISVEQVDYIRKLCGMANNLNQIARQANTVSIYRLEDIFEYNRDTKAIKEMRKSVEQYEQNVADRARRMEQAKLKEEEAQKLQNEAEKLKK